MAVTTTTIAGTDSLSGSRITINDNFKTLEDALNSVLSAFDIVSGRFDNSLYGSANDILTNGMVINGTGLTNALNINSGNINLVSGNITLPLANSIFIGNNLKLNNQDIPLLTSGNFPTWDFRDPGATSDVVGGMILPNLTGAGFTAMDPAQIPNGTLVFTDDSTPSSAPLRLWWNDGPVGPTWYSVGVTA
jgi:hypothetical protein